MVSTFQNCLFLFIVSYVCVKKQKIDIKIFHKKVFFNNISSYVYCVVRESTELPIIILACVYLLRCWFIHGVDMQSVKWSTCLHTLLGFDYHLPSSCAVEIVRL
jgi:hypothetical protein